ncbi:MAG: hypothetical protein K2N94_12275, partial [Lachnospiraceae bacterium]|nr:hypothetical protein [Lachnospiraceae bacterium]
MKIESSSIAMASSRSYTAIHEKKSAEIITRDDEAATIELSDKSRSMLEQLEENKGRILKEREERKEKNLLESLKGIGSGRAEGVSGEEMPEAKSKAEVQLEILKRMMEILKRLRGGNSMSVQGELRQLQSQYKGAAAEKRTSSLRVSTPVNGLSKRASTGWTRTTVKSEFFAEVENTCYQAEGVVRTADGRELNFGVSLEMSRGFCAKYESMTQEEYICTDPLVINL